jgi:hypothetical protein
MAIPFKTYSCPNWPQYRIRDLKFEDGILEVWNQREAQLVEAADGFGVQIVEIHPGDSVVPVQTEVAHQGTQATTFAPEVETEDNQSETPAASDEVVILGGGFYEYQGQKIRGKKNLPPEAQALL